MSIVKVGIIQMSCDADKTANNQKAIEKIREVAKQGAQIICLQELFSSLYFCDVESYDNFKLAEPIPGETSNTLASLAKELGVEIKTNQNVEKINVENGVVKSVVSNGETICSDVVLSGADYHHTETLLDKKYRGYSEKYWDSKIFAPSSLLFYVAFDKKIKNVSHHTLFFDTEFDVHAKDIYDDPKWPEKPLFYASFPSKTDDSVAPEGKEAGIFLIPIAPGIEDTPEIREKYFKNIIERFETLTQQKVMDSIIFKESFCVTDFINDYNSYKGNAYGLANILTQTAFLRPKIISKKVKNLFFTGQLTVPGPGVPPSIISGKIVSDLIHKSFEKN